MPTDVAPTDDPKSDLRRYLQSARDAVVWKAEGLSEYDRRRPLTPTGTNLLGLVKHLGSTELGYFGDTFARQVDERQPWLADDAEPDGDLWATADESTADILAFYGRATAFADATIDALPLDALGTVPWWPAERATVTLHRVLVHMIAETHRHAGHADIVRELVDGAAGLRAEHSNLAGRTEQQWRDHHARLERIARDAR